MTKVSNPILKGFYPDPSICAVGEDFYLVNSTFVYFPGVPIFHSKDLKNWEQIGHVLDRKEQLPLEETGHSRGIYAPTIRYYDGTFYMITTNVSYGGNFIVTAKDPAGPWSDPYYLGDDAPGIDPSLFFDEDGTCYYVGTRPNPEGVRYNGDWEIWVQRLDLDQMKLVGESTKIWKGALNGVIWPEGPHLYKKDGYYYLMIAEGGTGPDHSCTVARSKKVDGVYENNPDNPILTHRHLGKNYPIIYVGHGDLVEDKNGNWYMVMLASRPCEGYTNMGRETFLAKVTWENDWPVVNPGVGKLEDVVDVPLDEVRFVPKSSTYHFDTPVLDMDFVTLRNAKEDMYQFIGETNSLRLKMQEETLKDLASPSYVGVRQQDHDYQVTTRLELNGQTANEVAGLAILQSNEYHMRFEMYREAGRIFVQLVACEKGEDRVISQAEVPANAGQLKIVVRKQSASFYYQIAGKWQALKEDVSTTLLSTEVAGGFTGCTVGMYASANGMKSEGYADFNWFSYEAL